MMAVASTTAQTLPFSTRNVERSTENVAHRLSAGTSTTYASCKENCQGSATCSECNTDDSRKTQHDDSGGSGAAKNGCGCDSLSGEANGTPVAYSIDVKG